MRLKIMEKIVFPLHRQRILDEAFAFSVKWKTKAWPALLPAQ